MSYNIDISADEKCIHVKSYMRKGAPVNEHARNAPILPDNHKTIKRANNLLSKLKGRYKVNLVNQ